MCLVEGRNIIYYSGSIDRPATKWVFALQMASIEAQCVLLVGTNINFDTGMIIIISEYEIRMF